MSPKGTSAICKIAHKRLNLWQAKPLAMSLPCLFRTPEANKCLTTRLHRRETGANEIISMHGNVRFEFGMELRIDPGLAHHAEDTHPQSTKLR